MGTENPSGRRPRRKSGGRRRRSGKDPAASDPNAPDVRDSDTASRDEGAQATKTKIETEARPSGAPEREGDSEPRTPRRGRSRGKRGGRSSGGTGATTPATTGEDSGSDRDRTPTASVERPEPSRSSTNPALESSALEASGAPQDPSNGSEKGDSAASADASDTPAASATRKRTRGGRRRRGKATRAAEADAKDAPANDAGSPNDDPDAGDDAVEASSKAEAKAPKKKRRRARGSRSSKVTPLDANAADGSANAQATSEGESESAAATEAPSSRADGTDELSANGEAKPARSRSRRGGRGRRAGAKAKDKDGVDDKDAGKASEKTAASTKSGERLMLINTKEPEEVRVAILDDRELDDLLFESTAQTSYLNNIYLGRVVNIEPSIGAAFVDFGGDRNGFLHESDIVTGAIEANRQSPKSALVKTPRGERRPIQDLVRKGQSVLVQITKDGIGSKGPTLTTNISIPGRYLVLMPYLGRCGVSRKIPDKDERKRLKSLLGDLEPPADLGVIIRTAGVDRTKTELQKDLRYLLRLWDVISNRIEGGRAPATIYLESDLIIRTIRDYFTGDISRVLVDSDTVARKCTDFLRQVMPRYCNRVEHYSGKHPLFHEYGVEPQIEQIYRRRIDLPSGGSVVIEQTEALVAVDVNSGKYRENEDPEETAYRTDLEAIPVIVRQIRLRDLGGLLIIDFIDMQQEKHRRAVERDLRAALKRDRARAKMTRMSEFGIIEITRQRVRAGLGRANFESCPHCRGAGQIKTVESQVLAALRQIRAVLARDRGGVFDVAMHPQVASVLLNDKRRQLAAIEEEFSKTVRIHGQAGAPVEEFRVTRIPGA